MAVLMMLMTLLNLGTDQCVSLDTSYQAFSIVKGKWAGSDRRDADNIPSLRGMDSHHATAAPGPASGFEDITMLSGDSAPLATPSDFYRISPDTLQQWRQRFSGDGSEALADDFDIIFEGEDSDDGTEQLRTLEASDDSNPLHPIPDRVRHEVEPTVLRQISRLGPNPSGTSVAELVTRPRNSAS
jgi:hypothetical protein